MTSVLPKKSPAQAPIAHAQQAIHAALAAAPSVDLSWAQPPPTDNGWTLAPDALRFVMALVQSLKPRHILEMGAGLSTRALLRAATALQTACAISSVDHDPEFGPLATQQILSAPINILVANSSKSQIPNPKSEIPLPRLKFQVAPVVVRDFGGKVLPAYHIQPSRLASRRPVDLVLIDGPPVNMGGREGTLYQALELSRPGTVMLLDDAGRASERDAVAHWQDTLEDAITVTRLPGFAKGMVAIIVHQIIKRDELWQRRLDLSRRDIEKFIPPNERLMLIDHSMLADVLVPKSEGQIVVQASSLHSRTSGGPVTPPRALPFLEKDGDFYGLPADDPAAIAELQRQRAHAINFLVLAWPSYWWLETYPGFFHHLASTARLMLKNDRLMLFDLRA